MRQKAKPKEKQTEVTCHLFTKPSKEQPYVNYHFWDALFKVVSQKDYRSLPVQASQSVMKVVFQNWKSFHVSLKDYKQNPSKYKAKPKIPTYSRATEKEMTFTNQDCVIKNKKFLKFPKTKEELNIGKLGFAEGRLKQVRVIPKYNQYVVELVMEISFEKTELEDNGRFMSIDLGIDHLATNVTNTGRAPLLVKGKHVKSINQYYNKKKAYLLGILRQGKQANEAPFTSERLERLHQKRFLKMKDIFHKASSEVIKITLEENIHTIIIGQNKAWKQKSIIGKRNNQTFVSIPYSLLISMMTYKASQHGINVVVTEESYTSKARFLDGDDLPTYGESDRKKHFSGKRMKRGLYLSHRNGFINADVNGAANILKKTWLRLTKETNFNMETVNVWNPQTMIM